MRAHRRTIWLYAAVALVGVALLGCGFATMVGDTDTQSRYEDLAARSGAEQADKGDPSDNAMPASIDPAIAWVTVRGVDISLPVATGSKGYDWYLTHDLWDNPSGLGCPFLDPRCPSPDNAHVLVYGHNVSLSQAMFSPLHRCYRPEYFARLGPCLWTTGSGTEELSPLCALSVDKSWTDIMHFSFDGEGDLQNWAARIVAQAPARSDGAVELARNARRVVTLVTCSSEIPNQPLRTLVLFAN